MFCPNKQSSFEPFVCLDFAVESFLVCFFFLLLLVSSENVERLFNMTIYTQHANFRGKSLFQAIKQQLNNASRHSCFRFSFFQLQIKAAGDEHALADLDDSYAGREDDIKGALEKARKQLKRDTEIFDLAMGNPRDCPVTKVIAVPNVSRQLVTKLTAKDRDYGVSLDTL